MTHKYILEGKALELGDFIKSGGSGQQTFDQDLVALFRQELISHAEALRNATNREAMEMAMRGIGSAKPPTDQGGRGSRPAEGDFTLIWPGGFAYSIARC